MSDEELLDLLETAISNSMDIDWTPAIAARHVLAALRDEGVIPPPFEDEAEDADRMLEDYHERQRLAAEDEERDMA